MSSTLDAFIGKPRTAHDIRCHCGKDINGADYGEHIKTCPDVLALRERIKGMSLN